MPNAKPYPKTYRVQGIPSELTKDQSRELLREVLGANDELEVCSLGPNPYSTQRNTSQVATITLGQVPKSLQDGRDQWTFRIQANSPPNGENGTSSIKIDTHFLGFTPVNPVNGGPDHQVDCIAITGLSSHPFGSWKQRNGEFMWLRDCLPSDLEGARILLYGYNTNLLQSQAFQNIGDLAIAFSQAVRSIRQNNVRGVIPRPLVFISHSLGGVVLKKAIVHMRDGDETDRELFNSIYGVVFFGVPNQGIRIEHWLPMVKGQANENLIRDLGPHSTYLRTVHDEFRAAFSFPDYAILALYETEKTKVAKEEEPGKWTLSGNPEVLVPINSATDNPPMDQRQRYRIMPIKENHSDMVKFSSPYDEAYKVIVSQLKEFCEAATTVIQTRFAKEQGTPSDCGGWTLLHHAAFRGDENRLKELLGVQANVAHIERRDSTGRAPLHIAAHYGRDAAANALLNQGAYMDARNLSEQTPLHDAALKGHGSIAMLLVAQGADIEARDNEGRTPLYAAARWGHGTVVKLLADKGANKEARADGDWTPLHAAAWFGHESVVGLLIDGGANKDTTANDRRTPLHVAALNGHEAATAQLLSMGANREARTDARDTPLLIAAQHGRDTVARILLDKGADIEARNNEGRSPLYVAARGGHERVTGLLLSRGAHWDVTVRGGWTPLHAAAFYGHEAVSRVLAQCVSSTELRNEGGETALFTAASRGHDAIVRLLVERGADRKARDKNGVTPLKVAKLNRHEAVVSVLGRF
ncbi:MAG: hypothetical protein M1839_004517 [Geoglossum umbratile]|nr:MAG: hypothetical protein M1839_004517 [Geoglossum umbratile]